MFVSYILLWYNPKMGLCVLGSFLTFSAQGGRGKKKNKTAAKKFASPSEGAAEGSPSLKLWTRGVWGGNSAASERQNAAFGFSLKKVRLPAGRQGFRSAFGAKIKTLYKSVFILAPH